MSDPYAPVIAAAPGCCSRNRSLSPFLTFKVGGAADVYAEPQTLDEVGAVLAAAHREGLDVFTLGGGTNLLVRDGGIRGVVIRLGRGFRTVDTEDNRLLAGAAATMMQAATAAERASLAGFEFGYDIPGTVGGALRMNAGAHGSEIKDILVEVHGFDFTGKAVAVAHDQIEFSYRTAVYPFPILATRAVFALEPGDPAAVAEKRKTFHAYRLRTQPKGRSVGSVFKNPPGDHAGRLIEAAGLKGHRIGGAVVSDKHANWILSDRDATARDIEALILFIQATVQEQFSIRLEPEVKVVGENAPAQEIPS